jgi:hypothetical protein
LKGREWLENSVLCYNSLMDKITNIKAKSQSIKKEFQKRIVGYVVAAFGLVAGLAWNEAIRALIDYLFPLSKNSLLAKFSYAVLITLVLVIVTIYLTKIFVGEEAEKDKK